MTSPTRRGDRLLREHVHDPYQEREKPSSDVVCEDCSAVVVAGRWQEGAPPAGARLVVCPACRRVRDRCPAAVLRIEGPFHAEHADEISALVEHEAEAARSEHVLQRIMSVENVEDGIEVATTDAHLVRRIAHALERAYQGNLRLEYGEGSVLLRAWWER